MKTFVVRGGGRFPMSMLRFDCTWPFTLQTGSRFAPTAGRWESFNVAVEELS